MNYTVKSTKDGCVETLKLSNGQIFTKRIKKLENGYTTLDKDISEQMKEHQIDENIIKIAEELFDNVTTLNFIKLSELDK